MFAEMLGKRLEAIYALIFVHEMNRYRLDDTLVFQLSDGQFYQLLVAQVEKALRKMSDVTDVVLWGEYEADRRLVLEPIEIDVHQNGLLIGEIREYWANDGKREFLMGVVLADPRSKIELCVLTGGTEAELVNSELFMTAIIGIDLPSRLEQLSLPQATEG
jgi:hypothetical protein